MRRVWDAAYEDNVFFLARALTFDALVAALPFILLALGALGYVAQGDRDTLSSVHALLDRAAMEGTSLIIEGAHIVPGFLDPAAWEDRVLAVPVILTVEEEDVHRRHFSVRASDHAGRPASHYLDSFDNIRRVQRYIKSQALSHGVPVVPNYNFDRSLSSVIDLVMERATERTDGTRVGLATEGGSS